MKCKNNIKVMKLVEEEEREEEREERNHAHEHTCGALNERAFGRNTG